MEVNKILKGIKGFGVLLAVAVVVITFENTCNDDKPTSSKVPSMLLLVLFDDRGLAEGTDVWTWCGSDWGGPKCKFDGEHQDSSAAEGTLCFLTTSGANWAGHNNYAGWGIFLVEPSYHTVDLSGYSDLRFWVKTEVDIKVQIQLNSEHGSKRTVYISDHGWDGTDSWQEITVPADTFSISRLDEIFCPFMVTIERGSRTFQIDWIRWTY